MRDNVISYHFRDFRHAAFLLGLHCLPKHLFRGFPQCTKGLEWPIMQEVPKSDELDNIDTF